ncbi:hypothetical protein J7438_20030 [Thalassotalea sp. G20_0]|uniref:hypothetical protein n=1 Tax=Thalassotalea sp. G20_0 TaxID=2821093 RepID=UPI001ADBAB15|nr:hypothetical protein [Thalassotalea sp. G20_0]MBO9496349.1 hypothetical protein [Thalassotalea sp. G20_0]
MMINNNITAQPHLTNEPPNELLKQKEIIEQEKDDHNLSKPFQNNIFTTFIINQANKSENTPEKLSAEFLSKLEHHSVSTHEGFTWYDRKRAAYGNFTTEALPENAKKSKEPPFIKRTALQHVVCPITKDKQWLSFLQDFFKQMPIQASSINRITVLQTKAAKVKEIVFLVENKSYNRGYGNLNLYIEFLRNFVRLSPGTLSLIRFSGCKDTLSNKLPNLLSGLPDRDIDEFINHGDHRLSLPKMCYDKIFGIPYVIQDRIPNLFLSKDTLQIYTVRDSFFEISQNHPSIQITNYRWFPGSVRKNLPKNQENHLPIYPYEASKNTSTPELMRREIADSLQNSATHGYDAEKLVQFFTKLFQSAKEKKIYLALAYHASGMSKPMYYNYTNAAKSCFRDKPIIIIAPRNEKKRLSEKGRKELSDTGNIQFSINYSLDFTTEKSLKDNVTVFEFDFLPKRLFELVCYFSNIPIYAPGASTANIAQCLNKPYLAEIGGHEMTTIGNPEFLGGWQVANDAFDLDSFRIQEVKSALITMSKEQIKLCDRHNYKLWSNPENAHLEIHKICEAITDGILNYHGLIATLIPHFFNGTDTSKINEYTELSADDRKSYFMRLLDEGRLPEFCQYVCDKSNEILVDYMSRATTPGESFYELARELQQKALHPDNNMMLEVLESNLPSD